MVAVLKILDILNLISTATMIAVLTKHCDHGHNPHKNTAIMVAILKKLRPWLQLSQKNCNRGSSPHKNTAIMIAQRAEFVTEIQPRRHQSRVSQLAAEVGLILRSMGFDNTTRIYIAAGELFGGDRFMKPFRAIFPHLENHNTVLPKKLEESAQGLAGSAVDYMVCLLSDIFMPTYDGPSNFANNLIGHRLYYGFRTIIQPDRKALAPVFMDREEGWAADLGERVRRVMARTKFGEPHKRVRPESFYTNSWPECFCQMSPKDPADNCPPGNILEVLESGLEREGNVNNRTGSVVMRDA